MVLIELLEKTQTLVDIIKKPETDFAVSGILGVGIPLLTNSPYTIPTGPVCLFASMINCEYRNTSLTYDGLKTAKNLAIAFCRLFY